MDSRFHGAAPDQTNAVSVNRDKKNAEAVLRETLRSDPNSLELRVDLVRELYSAGRKEDARLESQALEGLATDEEKWKLLLKLFRLTNDYARAELVTCQFLRLRPNHEEAMFHLSTIMIETGRFTKSLELLNYILAQGSLNSDKSQRIVQLVLQSRDFHKAVIVATNALKIDPKHFALRLSLVTALHKLEQRRQIPRHLKALKRLAALDCDKWSYVAEIALWVNDKRTARHAITLATQNASVTFGSCLRVARVQLALGDPGLSQETLCKIDLEAADNKSSLSKILIVGRDVLEKTRPTDSFYDFLLSVVTKLGEKCDWPLDLLRFREELISQRSQTLSLPLMLRVLGKQ